VQLVAVVTASHESLDILLAPESSSVTIPRKSLIRTLRTSCQAKFISWEGEAACLFRVVLSQLCLSISKHLLCGRQENAVTNGEVVPSFSKVHTSRVFL